MEDFENLFQQAVSIKQSQMLSQREKFESLPNFLKAGLYFLETYKNTRRQSFSQRYHAANLLKENGNNYFRVFDYEKASFEYSKSLSIFRYIVNKNNNWKSEGLFDKDLAYYEPLPNESQNRIMLQSLKIALYLNLSICYLKSNKSVESFQAAEEALKLDCKNTKALFRRAKARVSIINSSLKDYQESIKDLEDAVKLDSENENLKKELEGMIGEYTRLKKKNFNGFKGMFYKEEYVEKISIENLKEKELENKELERREKEIKQKELEEEMRKEKEEKERKIAAEKEQKEREQKEKILKEELEKKLKKEKEKEIKEEKEKKAIIELEMQQKIIEQERFEREKEIEKQKIIEEINENAKECVDSEEKKISRKIKELGKFQEAEQLKEKLKKALEAKKQLEKLSALNFEKPDEFLEESAKNFSIDLKDPLVRKELLRIQEENIIEIKNWIEKVISLNYGLTNTPPQNINITNNIYINNTYINKEKNQEFTSETCNFEKERKEKVKEKSKKKDQKKSDYFNIVMIVVSFLIFFGTILAQSYFN